MAAPLALLQYGRPALSLDAVAAPANGASGTIFALPQKSIGLVTWNTLFGSAPSAVQIDVQVSNDNVVWSSADSSTLTAGEVKSFYTSARYIKALHVSRTGGGTVTVGFNILPAWANMVLGIGNANAQFEIVEDPNQSGLTKPVLRVTETAEDAWPLIIGNASFGNNANIGLAFFFNAAGSAGFFASQNGTDADANFELAAQDIILKPTGGKVEVTLGFFELDEIAAPSAPAANKVYLFTRDNGSGKTQLCAIFPTGAVQVIATQP